MANKKDKGQLPQHDERSSFLKTAIAAPAVAGTGVAVNKMRKNKEFSAVTSKSAMEKALGVAQRMAGSTTKGNTSAHVDWLRENFTSSTPNLSGEQRANVARMAWERAVQFETPVNRKKLLSFTDNMSTMEYEKVIPAIERTFETNTSGYMQKVGRRFRSHTEALYKHFETTQSLGLSSSRALQSFEKPISNVASTLSETGLKDYVTRIEESLGKATVSEISRPEFKDHKSLRFRFLSPRGQRIEMLLPIAKEGMLIEGETMSTRYIAPDIGIATKGPKGFEVERLSRHQFFMREFEQTILPEIESGKLRTSRDISSAIRGLRGEVINKLQYVENIPLDQEPSALKDYRTLRGKSIDIRLADEARYVSESGPFSYKPSVREPTDMEMQQIVKQERNLYGGVSAKNLATGRASTYNYAKDLMVPEAISWARSPGQRYRPWGSVEGAKNLRTVYLSETVHRKTIETMGIGEGEGQLPKSIRDQMNQKYITSKRIITDSIPEATLQAMKEGQELKAGTLLGVETKSGNPLTLAKNQVITSRTRHKNRSLGEFTTLDIMNNHRMRQHEKWFGDLKMMGQFVDDFHFNRNLNPVLLEHMGQVHVTTTTEALAKDPYLHAKQMITGMKQVIERRALGADMSASEYLSRSPRELTEALMSGDRGRTYTDQAKQFFKDPASFAAKWGKQATKGGVYHPAAFTRQLAQFGLEEFKMNAEEFGGVFGAVPEAQKEHGMAALRGRLRSVGAPVKSYMEQVGLGRAIGETSLTWGGPVTGAGGLGSVEPRILDMLSSDQYKKIGGGRIAEDITQRVIQTSPEKLAIHQELTKTLSSMTGTLKPSVGEAMFEAGALSSETPSQRFGRFLEEGGGWIKGTKGTSDIYVPGMDKLRAMEGFTTAGGQSVKGYLPDLYHGIAARAEDLAGGQIGQDQYRKYVEQTGSFIAKHQAPGGKGMGGYTRGKVSGSRFLTIVSQAESTIRGPDGVPKIYKPSSPNIIGVPEQHLKNMMAEMSETGLYNEKQVAAMEQQLAKTGRVSGMVARHPFIGQYSMQPVTFEAMKGVGGDIMTISERSINLKVKGIGVAEDIMLSRYSPLLGMAADKDADIAAAFLVAPDIEKDLGKRGLHASDDFAVAYNQHQVRLSLIKAKKAASSRIGLGEVDKMAAEMSKLATTQRWVPKLSTELSKARQAVTQGLTGRQQADAMFLLEWMEQTPISSKHINLRQVSEGDLGRQLTGISEALQTRNSGALRETIQSMIPDKGLGTELLQNDLMIQNYKQVEKQMGMKIGSKLQGANIEQTTKNIMSALTSYESSGRARLSELQMGKGRALKFGREAHQYLSTLWSAGKQSYNGVSQGMNAVTNTLGALGKGVIKHHKAIGLGFAGSLALAATLSTPEDTVGPGRRMNPKDVKMNVGKSASRMSPETMAPPHQNLGNPSVPPMMSQNRAMVSGPAPTFNTRVRARTNYAINGSNVAERMSRVANGQRNISLNIRDGRDRGAGGWSSI